MRLAAAVLLAAGAASTARAMPRMEYAPQPLSERITTAVRWKCGTVTFPGERVLAHRELKNSLIVVTDKKIWWVYSGSVRQSVENQERDSRVAGILENGRSVVIVGSNGMAWYEFTENGGIAHRKLFAHPIRPVKARQVKPGEKLPPDVKVMTFTSDEDGRKIQIGVEVDY